MVKPPAPSRAIPLVPQSPQSHPAPKKRAQKTRPEQERREQARVFAIFQRFAAANPDPQGELHYVNPYTLLVAVVLSAQATDVGVNKATAALFAKADDPQKMLDLGEDQVRDHIKTIGLFRAKAKNVILLSQQLLDRHGGQVPRGAAELEALAGVGRKTANVVRNIAFGEPTIAVDTHVFRVSNRLRLACGDTPLAVEIGLEKAVPPLFKPHAHHWLILHGRYVCKARAPACQNCGLNDLCPSAQI